MNNKVNYGYYQRSEDNNYIYYHPFLIYGASSYRVNKKNLRNVEITALHCGPRKKSEPTKWKKSSWRELNSVLKRSVSEYKKYHS